MVQTTTKIKGLTDEEIKTIMLCIEKATADECVAIAQRFNVQSQLLINKSEQRIQRVHLDEDY